MKENNNRNYRSNNNPNNNQRNHHNLLPSPRILEDYENIAIGSTNKLLEMAKKEQEHRHSWQDRYLKFHSFSYKIGLLFGFIYNVGLLALIYDLIKQDNQSLALKLFVCNTVLIAFAIVVTYIERKVTSRKPPRRIYPNKDRHSSPKTNQTTS
jgi:uncharacterized membrane protein